MKTIHFLMALFLFNYSLCAQEKNFRGWKAGDWIIASSFLDQKHNLEMAEIIKDPEKKIKFIYDSPYEETFWCKINAVGDNCVLVTGYFQSIRTVGQVNRNEIRAYQKIEGPLKFNLMGNTNLHLFEWPVSADPPRPRTAWWSLFQR